MTQINTILEIERGRKEIGDYTKINLFVEGSFYRAYEWSAWLCCRYINQFKTTKREIKSENGEAIVYVGFPITSLSRYLPENSTSVTNDDKTVEITLPISGFSEENKEQIQIDFNNWKNSVPMAVSKKATSLRDDLKNNGGEHPHRMSDIMLRIISFPLENKTPMECMNFIAELKQQITSLI